MMWKTSECYIFLAVTLSTISIVNGWLFLSRDTKLFGSVKVIGMQHFYFMDYRFHYKIICECKGDKNTNWTSIGVRLDPPNANHCLNISSNIIQLPDGGSHSCESIKDWASVSHTGKLYTNDVLTLTVLFNSGHETLSWKDLSALKFRCGCGDYGVQYAGRWMFCNPSILGLHFNYELWWHYIIVVMIVIIFTQVMGIIGFHIDSLESKTAQKFAMLFFCSPCLFPCTIAWFIKMRLKIFKLTRKGDKSAANSSVMPSKTALTYDVEELPTQGINSLHSSQFAIR